MTHVGSLEIVGYAILIGVFGVPVLNAIVNWLDRRSLAKWRRSRLKPKDAHPFINATVRFLLRCWHSPFVARFRRSRVQPNKLLSSH